MVCGDYMSKLNYNSKIRENFAIRVISLSDNFKYKDFI
jgi:hypothetical protein